MSRPAAGRRAATAEPRESAAPSSADARGSLARRMGWVMAGVVVIAVGIAALISVSLIRTAGQSEARKALADQASIVVALLDAGRPASFAAALKAVRDQDVPVAQVRADGTTRGDPLARRAATERSDALAAGADLSYKVDIDDREVYVETRALASGGSVVFAKNASLALGPTFGFLRRELLALAIGLAVALLASFFLARRLAAPLRRTADAAQRLASGERDVRLRPDGPQELAEVAQSINTLAAALELSESRQREFLLSVSHELRTPLTAIRGFGESLADGVSTGDAVQPAGRTIVAESTRLERLVADLLDLARLGADDFRFEHTAIDVRALLVAAAEVWQARSAAAGLHFATELPATEVWMQTDPMRLRQIIDGLAENALRVTPAGQPLIFALTGGPQWVSVEVRDGGPGLTAQDMAVAFERSALYERYRGIREVGTGLGLALVKALAVGLGGTASVARSREGGSTFAVHLPVSAPAVTP